MDYVNQIDLESQTQFAAITVALGDGRHFVAFRGTDGTLVGWKEDFNMAFTCPVPAQRLAAHYAASAMLRFPGSSCSAVTQGRQPRGLCRSVLPRSPAGAHRGGV